MLRNCLLILNIKNDIACNKGHERHKAIKIELANYILLRMKGEQGCKESYLVILKPSVHQNHFGCLLEEHMPGPRPHQFWFCRFGVDPRHL